MTPITAAIHTRSRTNCDRSERNEELLAGSDRFVAFGLENGEALVNGQLAAEYESAFVFEEGVDSSLASHEGVVLAVPSPGCGY